MNLLLSLSILVRMRRENLLVVSFMISVIIYILIGYADLATVTDVTTASHSPPSSMPIPSVPRRAGPPRRKSAKSPAPSTETDQQTVPSAIDVSAAETSSEIMSPETKEDQPIAEPSDDTFESEKREESGDSTTAHESPEAGHELSGSANIAHEHEEEASVEEEEDEASRRKRIAERIAKSGGLNPFAGPLPPVHPTSTAPDDDTPIADKVDDVAEDTTGSEVPEPHTEELSHVTVDVPSVDDYRSHDAAEEEESTTNIVSEDEAEDSQKDSQGTEEKHEEQDGKY